MVVAMRVALLSFLFMVLNGEAHVLVESMISRSSFSRSARSNPNKIHELVFAAVQLEAGLDELLTERSTPGRAKYQQWLTFSEVHSLTSNLDGFNAILDWLGTHQIEVTWQSAHQEYIKATAPIATWERLLNATFYEWTDNSRKKGFLRKEKTFHRASQYSLPTHIRSHISAVFNTVQVPPEWRPKFRRLDRVSKRAKSSYSVTPDFLNTLYKITPFAGSIPASLQQSVFETSHENFSPSDLDYFQTIFNLPRIAALAPYGHATDDCVYNSCGEGNLDVQYIMGIAPSVATIYWYTGASDPFLSFITDLADSPNPPLVNSISWGSEEYALALSSMHAFNTEARKLALQGVTIVVSSGDDGAVGDASWCNADSSSSSILWGGHPWSGKGYFPSFPATSPYVTAVGATQGPEAGKPEIAAQSQEGGVITSGGGFSTYFPTPDYQKDTVTRYFNSLSAEQSPSSGYNRRGRAYPDVALIGVWYQIIEQGYFTYLFGTSASAPVFGAMVSMLNAVRASQNKSSLGFLNPTLYAAGANASSALFNDVTSGHSKCPYTGNEPSEAECCKSGFYATPGWDPLTGWGSVNFDNLGTMFDTPAPYTYPKNNGRAHYLDLATRALIILVGATLTGAVLGGIIFAMCFAKKKKTPLSGDIATAVSPMHSATLDASLSAHGDEEHPGSAGGGPAAVPRSGFLISLMRSPPGSFAAETVYDPLASVRDTYVQPS